MIGLIVAHSRNNAIGAHGRIPWRIKGEQRYFKNVTTGNVVIMGRKTYEEIGKPLPDRVNIVLTSNPKNLLCSGEGVEIINCLDDAIDYAKEKYPEKDIFIIGGQTLYDEAMAKDIVDEYHITTIHRVVLDADRYFNKPDFEPCKYEYICRGFTNDETGGVAYSRAIYRRKSNK